jgi:hypothetical protein
MEFEVALSVPQTSPEGEGDADGGKAERNAGAADSEK